MDKPNFIFTPPVLCDRKGDLRKYWYIDFSVTVANVTTRLQIQSGKEYGMVGCGNDDFLKTQFRRFKAKRADLFTEGQTFYSFKHMGCIAFYETTKDIYLLCRLCEHTSIKTTERYLRSLGVGGVEMGEFVPSIT